MNELTRKPVTTVSMFLRGDEKILSGETQEHLRKGKSTSLLTLSVDRFLEYSYKHSVRKDDKDIN